MYFTYIYLYYVYFYIFLYILHICILYFLYFYNPAPHLLLPKNSFQSPGDSSCQIPLSSPGWEGNFGLVGFFCASGAPHFLFLSLFPFSIPFSISIIFHLFSPFLKNFFIPFSNFFLFVSSIPLFFSLFLFSISFSISFLCSFLYFFFLFLFSIPFSIFSISFLYSFLYLFFSISFVIYISSSISFFLFLSSILFSILHFFSILTRNSQEFISGNWEHRGRHRPCPLVPPRCDKSHLLSPGAPPAHRHHRAARARRFLFQSCKNSSSELWIWLQDWQQRGDEPVGLQQRIPIPAAQGKTGMRPQENIPRLGCAQGGKELWPHFSPSLPLPNPRLSFSSPNWGCSAAGSSG